MDLRRVQTRKRTTIRGTDFSRRTIRDGQSRETRNARPKSTLKKSDPETLVVLDVVQGDDLKEYYGGWTGALKHSLLSNESQEKGWPGVRRYY